MNKTLVWMVTGAAAVLAVIGAWWLTFASAMPPQVRYLAPQLEFLAKCLTAQGAKMYGASWCSHCQSQKAAFGTAANLLPYIECGAGPRPQDGETPVCAAAKIMGYPTWVFANGTRREGEQHFSLLATQAGCGLPTQTGTFPLLTGSAVPR